MSDGNVGKTAGRGPGRRLAAACVMAAGIATLGGGTAAAYSLTGEDWSYKPSPMGEPMQICVSGAPSGASNIIKQAASRWNYGRFRFTFKGNGCSSGGRRSAENGVNQIDFGSLSSGQLAQTTWFFDTSTGNTTECDIRFNRSIRWYVGLGTVPSGSFDLFTVALHELGHCLGLGHSNGPGWPVMVDDYSSGEWNRALTSDDIAGRNAIYGN